jgi:hypothetical protein
VHAKPRRDLTGFTADLESVYDGDMRTISAPPGTVVLECAMEGPPSMKGRTVYVVFEGEDLTDALKLLRDEAIRARAQPLSAASG